MTMQKCVDKATGEIMVERSEDEPMRTLLLALMVMVAVVLQLSVMAGDVIFVCAVAYIGIKFSWLWSVLLFWLFARSLDDVGGVLFCWKPKNIKSFFCDFVGLATGKESTDPG